MNTLSPGDVRGMLLAVTREIIANEDMLCRADREIGDGDHGIGMRRGFTAAATRLEQGGFTAADDVFRATLDLGGTLTGEHGVGALKRRWIGLELGDDGLDVHRAIKHALDPAGILNPGKAF